MTNSKLKLIAFDMDGTITTERSSWEYLHREMGVWEETAHIFQERFYNGEISYEEFCRLDASMWRGVDREKASEILSKIELRPAIKEVFGHLRRAGVKIALISSGLKLLADHLAEILPFDWHLANELVSKKGLFTGEAIIHVSTDVKGIKKEDHLHRMMAECGALPEETAAVGDSLGDLEMFRKAKNALLIGAQPNEQEIILKELPKVKLIHYPEDILKIFFTQGGY